MALKPLNSVGGFSVGEVPANVILANADITANKGTFVGNVAVSNSNASYGILTDNLYYSNGQPWDLQEAAGSNTQIQFNNNNDFGASANFTFDTSTNLLTVVGNTQFNNANLGNLATANFVNVSSNLKVSGKSDLGNVGNVIITGGSANQYLQTDGAGNLTWTTADTSRILNGTSNVSIPTLNGNVEVSVNGTSNVLVVSATGANVTGTLGVSSNLSVLNANLGNLAEANFVNVSSNINVTNTMQAGNVRTDNLLYANGNPWDLQEAAGSNTQIQYNDGLNNFGASANFTYNDATQVLTVAGNANITNTLLTPNVDSGSGNLTLTSNGKSTVYDTSGNVTFPVGGTVTAGTFVGNVQANITITAPNTSILFSDNGLVDGSNAFTFNKLSNLVTIGGNLQSDNANLGNLAIANYVNVASNVTTSNLTVNLELAGNTANFSGNVVLNGDNVTVGNALLGNTANFSGNVVVPNLAVNLELAGNTANFTGNLAAGNANLGNLIEANFANIASNLVVSNANVTGTLTVANANISSNLTVNNLTVNLELAGNTANFTGNVVLSGPNVTVNNYLSGNIANFSGNITSLNANLGNIADANFVRSSELYNGNSNVRIAPNGNVTVSATGVGDVLTISNVGANIVGYVHANGNGTFGALYSNTLTAQGGNLTIYAATGDNYVELRPTGNGHVDVGNFRIQSLQNPVNPQDAATKFYVDTVAEGLHIHASCGAATPNTLANLSGGVVTYNNGTAGVGATLTTTGTYTLIDGVNVASVGFRILVKNEVNLAHNGIYVYTNSTTLTRASDFDTPAEIAGGDFTFVTGGTLYDSTGWVNIDDVTTVGTDPIEWEQFSGAGEYTAGQGLTLTGTVFSVNVDNITTEIAGGNVVVKANAQFTTPNIGAATGTSLDLTGNLLANNVNSNNLVTTTDLQASGNILSNNISANANLIVNNATVNLELSGNTANFSGNVVVPNLTVNTTLSGNTANFSGNIVVNNATVNLELTGNTANFSGNIVAGNISTSGSGGNISGANVVSANTFSGNLLSANFANIASNTITSNLSVNLELGGNTANFTGNLVAANLVTSGTANIANLNVTANVTSALTPNANLTLDLGTSTQRWANVYAGNIDASGNLTIAGNLQSNNYTANIITANTQVNVGNTTITWDEVTTTAITANQTISTFTVTGVTGVQWLVKGLDSGGKHSIATVQAVTDGTAVDWAVFGGVTLGGSTGTLAVNIAGSNIELQVTPASSNSTLWVTQYRLI
jgi:hypothetical protein